MPQDGSNPTIGLALDSCADAAARLLQARLDTVADLLASARRAGADNPQHVHQLRVATRRASAAIIAFKPHLDRPLRRRMVRRLHRIRDAAAEIRQCDVHLGQFAELQQHAAEHAIPVLQFVADRIARRRLDARESVVAVARRYRRGRFKSLSRRLIRSLDADMPSLADVGSAVVERLHGRVIEAAACDLRRFENLHQLRIAGKKLRYALELFNEGAHEPRWRELHQRVMNVQDRLGQMNDSYEIACRLERYLADVPRPGNPLSDEPPPLSLDELRAGLAELAELYREELDLRRRRFLEWWPTSGIA